MSPITQRMIQLILALVALLAAAQANAQTTANGPYYANPPGTRSSNATRYRLVRDSLFWRTGTVMRSSTAKPGWFGRRCQAQFLTLGLTNHFIA
jgi:hypothetical protein